MCVKIARDVLAQLRINRYIANPGLYVEVESPELDCMQSEEYNRTIQRSFKNFFKDNKNTTCHVCAIGAAFVSLVNIEDRCSIMNMMHKYDTRHRLEKYFGNYNMSLIESAFECTSIGDNKDEFINEAANWGSKYSDPKKRLRAIMLNIIRNKGEFKLPNTYTAKAKRIKAAKNVTTGR